MMLQVNNGNWCQETYETGSKDIKARAKVLRKLGYKVISSNMGMQVTEHGLVKLTMLDIIPGKNVDTINLP